MILFKGDILVKKKKWIPPLEQLIKTGLSCGYKKSCWIVPMAVLGSYARGGGFAAMIAFCGTVISCNVCSTVQDVHC